MSIVIACPICTQKVRVPETVLGKNIKCPQCKNSFLAQDPDAPPTKPQMEQGFANAAEATPQSAFSTLDEIEEDAEPQPGRSAGGFIDYLLFRRMVTPVIIVVLFYLGILLQLAGALYLFVMGIVTIASGTRVVGLLTVLASIVGTIVGMIVWRIFCEVLITMFRILDNVREINEQTKQKEK
jgi:hypothetical protein